MLYDFVLLLCNLAFFIPIDFLPDMMVNDHGVLEINAGYIVPIIGAGHGIGRVLVGLAVSKLKLNPTGTTTMCLLACAACSFIFTICSNYTTFVIAGITFGLTVGPNGSLVVECLVQMYGMELVKDTFGIMMIVYAIGSLIGPLVGGFLDDISGNYNATFYFCGVIYLLAAAVCFMVLILDNNDKKKRKSNIQKCRVYN